MSFLIFVAFILILIVSKSDLVEYAGGKIIRRYLMNTSMSICLDTFNIVTIVNLKGRLN